MLNPKHLGIIDSVVGSIDLRSIDKETADAFALSWNHLPDGSVYSADQIEDWFAPIGRKDVQGKSVLELGCGNGSLLSYLPRWRPESVEGVDLGDSVLSCAKNMHATGYQGYKVTQADMIKFESDGFDVVYSIGVLHHLKDPAAGFRSVLRNTKPGGRFHCWVYAEEGNAIVMSLVEPIRRVASKLPWWITKYVIATPLAIPFFAYAKTVAKSKLFSKLPLFDYSRWISKREFAFFRHVAFDQLVTPQTTYISRETIEGWLKESNCVLEDSTYVVFRNGNSWKFGGVRKNS